MRLSTRLFIHVLAFALNFNVLVFFSLLREPLIMALAVAFMAISYHHIHHVMKFLDVCEETTGETDEHQ